MIAWWMVAASIFAALLGAAAVATERALRSLGRQTRGPWLAALVVAASWPIVALLASILFPSSTPRGVRNALPAARSAIRVIADRLPPVPDATAASWNGVLIGLWVFASIVLLGRLWLAMRALARVEKAAGSEEVAGVPVLVTPTLGPAVFGFRRPRVLVPRWLFDLDEPLRTLVLRHEQEHCLARDPQLTLAVAVTVALMPWNPGVWWIARRLRLAMEVDCDARVLRAHQDPVRYGRLLLFIAQRQANTIVAPMLAESSSRLDQRIAAMNTPLPVRPRTRVAGFVLLAGIALACSTKVASDLTAPAGLRPSATVASRGAKVSPVDLEGARPAMQAPNSPSPHYPDILRSAGVEGEVWVAFVIDTTGAAIPGTLKIMRSTHALFANAVKLALPNMRFQPAELRTGRKVKELVEQHFVFEVQPTRATTTSSRPTDAGFLTPDPNSIWKLPSVVIKAP
jgi:beta-lactamase regulating signal transducer with metallopeptidase domain